MVAFPLGVHLLLTVCGYSSSLRLPHTVRAVQRAIRSRPGTGPRRSAELTSWSRTRVQIASQLARWWRLAPKVPDRHRNQVFTEGCHLSRLESDQTSSPSLALALGDRVLKGVLSTWGTPEIVHAHDCLYGGLIGQRIATKLDVPLVVTIHSSAFPRQLFSPSEMELVRGVLGSAQRVVAVSSFLARSVADSVRAAMNPEVIPNVVDPVFFGIARSPYRHQEQRFLAVGNLIELKRFDDLITAFSELPSRSATLTIAGDGPLRSRLVQLARRLECEGRVRFIGHVDRQELASEMEKADTLVSTSQVETFGVAVAEAMAAALPVVVTESGGPQDFVDSRVGWTCPVADLDSLAEAMGESMNDEAHASRGLVARTVAAQRFSPAAVYDRLAGLYSGVR